MKSITIIVLRFIRFMHLTSAAKQVKFLLQKASLWPEKGVGYTYRDLAYAMLSGRGLEIGALHFPASVPRTCVMEYCDAQTREQSAALFPELEPEALVTVHHVVDLDTENLSKIKVPAYDFAVMNHVIEHVANPISVLEQLFAVVKDDGIIVVSAPDKEYTFDRDRPLTSFEHLLDEYRSGVTRVDDDHYLEVLRYFNPEVYYGDNPFLKAHKLEEIRSRREHAHVWDSRSFMAFLQKAMEHLNLRASIVFESPAIENNLECLVVLRKIPSH